MDAVREEIRRTFIKGGRAFLLASVERIPVWTGMARGALRNAEDIFGQVASGRIDTRRGGRVSNKTGLPRPYYYYPPTGGRIERTPEAGRQFATQPDEILQLTGASLAKGRTAFYFRFNVDITYFNVLDAVKWGAMKAGTDAFENYIRNNIDLPDPLTYTTRKLYRVD